MSDDKTDRGSPDRDRINVNQQHELRYWSEKFGVTPDELKLAVQDVGPTVAKVQQRLQQRH
jgi:hypothetical protein